ncbi:MAG: AsmA family protein, partial [Deltaproteobacteria bacterium]|nr:AsmA family protein [Deltaproteobacteria bacterium]
CTLRVGLDEKPAFSMKGRILGIEDPKKTAIDATFEAYVQPWVEKLMQRSVPKKHRLFCTVKVTGLTDHFRIRELKLTTEDAEHLSLKVNGDVKEKEGSFETDIQIAVNSKDPSAIGSIFEISMPAFAPISVNGRFKSKGEQADFEGETHFGKTYFKTIISHSITRNHKPTIIIRNTSDNVFLSDLGIYPEEDKEEKPTQKKKTRFLRGRLFRKDSGEKPDPKKKAKSKPDRIFSQDPLPFDVLKGLNLSLSIDADKLIGRDFVIKNLDFDLSLKDGLLHISPARLSYAEGEVSFESTVDTTGETPEVMLKATAEDVDMDALLAYMHRPIMMGGNLNLAVDLKGVGSSLHEIMSSLNGEIGYAIENGKIKRDVEMLTGDAIDLVTALPRIRGYQDLNCLTMRFIFDQGIGRSEILFLDTAKVRTRGGATIDLASESLDMVLQPKPKKGLPGMSSAIRIQGPLANPSIRKMPYKEAARLYGEIFLPFVFLPARGLGYLWYLMKNDKDEESPCLNLAPQTE